jgi:hypothetical protein
MRVSRVLMAAGLAVLVGIGSVAVRSAQAKTDEEYGTCMTCHTKYREKTESGFAIKKVS